MSPSPRIAIVGAGPAGLTLAVILKSRGISPVIFELRRKPTDEELAKPSGSLDLHVESGLAAITECGLWEQFSQLTRYCSEAQIVADKDGRILHRDEGELSERPEISRHALIKLLSSCLPSDSIRWGHRLISATEVSNPAGAKVELDFGDCGKHFVDLVIGADGAWSKVRNLLTKTKPYYAGIQSITLDISQLTTRYPHLDALVGRGSFSALGLHHAVMSQRGPQDSARIYVFLTSPNEGAGVSLGLGCQSAHHDKKIILTNDDLLGRWSSTIKELVAVACDQQAMNNPRGSINIRPLYTLPIGTSWVHNPCATLVGDAAHLMCPWAGEGVNLAMWDSLSLAHTINEAIHLMKPAGPSFRSVLSPLLKKFEEDQAKRAKEKAEETEKNGKMLFGQDGARAFAQFFQSVYGPTNKENGDQDDGTERQKTQEEIVDTQEDRFPHIGREFISTVDGTSHDRPSTPQDQLGSPDIRRGYSQNPHDLTSRPTHGHDVHQQATTSLTTSSPANTPKPTARGLDHRGNAILTSDMKTMAVESQRALDVNTSGDWPDVDWSHVDGQPHYRVATNNFGLRAISGQRFGHAAPPGEECTNCRDGNGPFKTCKIAYIPEVSVSDGRKPLPAKVLFGGGCMGCGLSGSGHRCSLRKPPEPQWVRDYLAEKVPAHKFSVPLSRKSITPQKPRQQRTQNQKPSTPRRQRHQDAEPFAIPDSPTPSSTLTPGSVRRHSNFTSTSQGHVMVLPSPGPRYLSPLKDENVYEDIQLLDQALLEVRLAKERACFDIDLLVRRRNEIFQAVDETTEGYEHIGRFANLISSEPSVKMDVDF
ncbi:hypothetical protein PENSTE_c010G01543 [Penicillium steckii]|uniref:FAD-binding domain-containing protein n=1 Tax=Penicillium steckii TaxID=303698 RepID=A0A1V6T8Z8_9EURO|nr:hypothetical protein PENSTE_c010G01543 [Penicillium steckii]